MFPQNIGVDKSVGSVMWVCVKGTSELDFRKDVYYMCPENILRNVLKILDK